MGDWGRFAERVVENAINNKSSAQDSSLRSKAKRKARSKVIGSVTRASVDTVDSMTKPMQKTVTRKISQITDQIMGLSDEGELLSDSYAGSKLLMCENKKLKNWFMIYGLGYNICYQVRTEGISKNTIITDPEGEKLVLIKR